MTDNVNVVVTTNDSNSEKANYNYELLFQKDNTSIFGDNLPSSILQIEAESTSDVTSETVEQGGFASFYKTKQPKNINFDIAFNTDDEKQQSILDTIYDIQCGYDLITAVTPTKIYENLTITSVSYSRTSEDGMTMLVLKLQLQEIVQVNIELGRSTATFTPKRPTSGKKQELGKKQAAEKEEMGTSSLGETMNDTVPAGVDPIPLKK